MIRSARRQPAVIFDCDGTLANVSGIRHYVRKSAERKYKDFDAFHRESVNAPANQSVVDFAHEAHEAGYAVIIVTARRVKWARQTAMWLALNGVPSDAMFMRGNSDGRSDVDVKRDILAAIRQTWDVVHAVDDNPKIVELWRSEGIPVSVVPGWEE